MDSHRILEPDGSPDDRPESGPNALIPGLTRRAALGLAALAAGSAVGITDLVGLFSTAASAATTLYWPTVSTRVSDGGDYGADRGAGHTPRYHEGVDINIPVGTAIYGCGSGTVTTIANTGTTASYGLYVLVTYGDSTVITAHMSSTAVQQGDAVTVNTVLGASGGTKGSFGAGDATGPHCHVETRTNGARVNPHGLFLDRSQIGQQPQELQGELDMMVIQSTGRGIALVGGNFAAGNANFRQLQTNEEVSAAQAVWGRGALLNDRQFDVVRALSTGAGVAT